MTVRLVQSARRRLYRGKRPGATARALNRVQARLAAHGIGPSRVVALDVRGRRTGRTISMPIVVTDYDHERYLVSMFGEHSTWVRNVRAAGGDAVIRHRTRQPVHLAEIPPEQRPPILKRYLAVAPGARPHLPVDKDAPLSAFEHIAAAPAATGGSSGPLRC
jgi:deazaflavin-dependent oxidoreductase (nitroreductase family)